MVRQELHHSFGAPDADTQHLLNRSTPNSRRQLTDTTQWRTWYALRLLSASRASSSSPLLTASSARFSQSSCRPAAAAAAAAAEEEEHQHTVRQRERVNNT
jgi:hypothetical protein